MLTYDAAYGYFCARFLGLCKRLHRIQIIMKTFANTDIAVKSLREQLSNEHTVTNSWRTLRVRERIVSAQ
jgi:hypothetical protein